MVDGEGGETLPKTRSWWRWVLAGAVAGLVPLTMASNGCKKTTVEPPSRDSGADTAADHAPPADGETTDGPSGPDVATDTPVDRARDTSGDLASPCSCDRASSPNHCVDGRTLATCATQGICPESNGYVWMWFYQTCPGACTVANDDAGQGAACR
jgi:hypothetical protein